MNAELKKEKEKTKERKNLDFFASFFLQFIVHHS